MGTDDTAHAPTLRIEALPGQSVVTEVRGRSNAPVALLLHGLPGDRGTWTPVARRLEDGRRVIVPDLLGFGESDRLEPGQHAEAEARAMLGLLDQLEVDRADLVAHDFGGPIALWLWRLAPARVRSLTLIATNGFRDTPIPGVLRLALVPGIGDLMFRVLFSRIGLLMTWRQATGDRRAYPLGAYRMILRSEAGVRSTRRVFLDSLRRLDPLYREVEAALETVTVPRLVIWGDRDPFFPVGEGRRLAKALGAAPLEILPGCGHFVPQERPREVALLVRRLWGLREAPAAAGVP